MRRLLLAVGISALVGCQSTATDFQPTASAVPTPPPNAEHQQPAFPGQTRAPQAVSKVGLKTQTVTEGLEHPWGMTFLPDGRLLITEKPGRLRMVTQQGEISEPISGVPQVDSRKQGGLLDVTLDPDFATNRWVYLSYAEPRDGGKTGTSVARGRLSDDAMALQAVEVIFRQMPSWDSALHYGSRLVWDPDGRLFITLGERFGPESRKLAQDLQTHLGKVVRIRPDGAIPKTNPFTKRDQGLPKIWSYGHRNIQGAALHPQTGELWVIEHGPKGGDEINIAEAGKNYGWPVITYGEDYAGEPIGEGLTQKEGMEQPIYYWDPVIAPAGSIFYQGTMIPQWQGNLLISSLEPGGLVRLELDGRRVTGEERLLSGLGRVRDVEEGPSGDLWLITDQDDARLIRITKR